MLSVSTTIYIYCVSVFALATQRIFKISGFDVECFIDQNNAFRGKTYSGVTVEIPSQAFLKIKKSPSLISAIFRLLPKVSVSQI